MSKEDMGKGNEEKDMKGKKSTREGK